MSTSMCLGLLFSLFSLTSCVNTRPYLFRCLGLPEFTLYLGRPIRFRKSHTLVHLQFCHFNFEPGMRLVILTNKCD